MKWVSDRPQKKPTSEKPRKKVKEFEDDSTEDEEHSIGLLNLIQSLPPLGFEKLCKRLLTEIGINDIIITGVS